MTFIFGLTKHEMVGILIIVIYAIRAVNGYCGTRWLIVDYVPAFGSFSTLHARENKNFQASMHKILLEEAKYAFPLALIKLNTFWRTLKYKKILNIFCALR